MKRQLAATTITLLLATTTGVLSTPRRHGRHGVGARRRRVLRRKSWLARIFDAVVTELAEPLDRAGPDAASPAPQRSGWGAGLMGGLGGLVLGGLIGSMLFGGMGGGFGGGFGLLEMLLLGGLAYFAFSFLRRRREAQPAMAGGYGTSYSGVGRAGRRIAARASSATLEAPAGPTDLQVGIGHIRQMDAAFDPARMAAAASDVFFKVQAAWMARDMGSARDSLTPEMYDRMQGQCAELKAQRRINRLENIAVRSTDVTEAWQEQGQDFVTVAFVASVLDYTTDEAGTVIDGSRTEPVRLRGVLDVRPAGRAERVAVVGDSAAVALPAQRSASSRSSSVPAGGSRVRRTGPNAPASRLDDPHGDGCAGTPAPVQHVEAPSDSRAPRRPSPRTRRSRRRSGGASGRRWAAPPPPRRRAPPAVRRPPRRAGPTAGERRGSGRPGVSHIVAPCPPGRTLPLGSLKRLLRHRAVDVKIA